MDIEYVSKNVTYPYRLLKIFHKIIDMDKIASTHASKRNATIQRQTVSHHQGNVMNKN